MPAQLARIEISLRRTFLPDLQTWCERRGQRVELAVAELLECELARMRTEKITRLSREELLRPAPEIRIEKQRGCDPITTQLILHLAGTGMPATDIAKRVRRSASTVRRVLRAYSPRVRTDVLHRARKPRSESRGFTVA